jgi:ribosomal protein S12 methylthiotransferase accessory factor
MSARHAVADRLQGAGRHTPLETGLTRLRSLASPYVGVVKDVTELLHDADDVRSYYIGTGTPDTTDVLGHPCNSMNGGGAFSRDEALAAALGESIERYAAAHRPVERILVGTAAEFGRACIDPARCALFAPEQHATPGFPYQPFTETTTTSWIDGIDLRSGDAVLIPAQMVLLNSERARGEQRICYGTSSGLACHSTIAEATLGGLFELAERDAVMIAWHARLTMPQLDLAADPALRALLDRHVTPTGLRYSAVDLTAINGVPTVLGVVINDVSNVGALGVGAASAPTLAEAAVKAILEAFQTRTWSKSMQRSTPRVPDDADLDRAISDFDAHVRYYADAERLPLAEFLWASDERVDPREGTRLEGDTPGELIASFLEVPQLADVSFYATDLTTVDVRDADLRVVRCYSPELQPLDVGFRTRFLGGQRLRHRPVEMGCATEPLTFAQMNPAPHPFP